MANPFPTLLGNEGVRDRLAALASAGRLHPCLIFEGPAGVGKATTARWLAATVNCTAEPQGARPCGGCWSCRQIARDQHPDVICVGLDPERTAPIISVEQARKLVGALTLHPYNARTRFVILDPADALTTEAANALLKTLEEPPTSTGFILVTGAVTRLLPTVRSRAQRVRFAPVDQRPLLAWLEGRGVPEAAWVALQSEGCPGVALALAEGEATARREARDALLAALAGSDSDRFAYAENLLKGDRAEWSERVDRALDALAMLIRDGLKADAAGHLYNQDQQPLIRRWSRALGAPGAARLSVALEAARRDLQGFVNGRLVLEALLAQVAAELGDARREQGAA